MTFDLIIKKLMSELDKERYLHSINVMELSITLAEHYGVDVSKARVAGILHDCGKNYKGDDARTYIKKIGYEADEIELKQTRLLHGIIGEHLARITYGINDPEILGAIRWHTTGKAEMSVLEKIVYVADYIEPSRSFEDIDEMRREAFRDLDKCIVLCADSTISYILKRGFLLHEKTVETRNFSLMSLKEKNTAYELNMP